MSITTPDHTDGPTAPNSDLEARDTSPATASANAATRPETPTMSGSNWPRRHRRGLVLATMAVAMAGAVAFALTRSQSDTSSDASDEVVAIRTVEATTGDLLEFLTVEGTLAFEDPVAFAASVDGTITEIAELDAVLQRGGTAYAVDAEPVVVLWGDFPIYRPLTAGVEDGADVSVLEANLAALGYTADGSLVIDDSFDTATTAAIEAFQADVGLTVDGTINPASVLVLPGPAIVADTDLRVGSTVRSGEPVLSLQVTDATTTVALATDDAADEALVTDLPSVGDSLDTGDVAYEIDTEPVIVIVGDTTFDRDLSIETSDGPDVELIEQALLEQGYDAGGDLEVDEHFDEATTEALSEWEEALGLNGDGVATLNEFVVLPTGHRVTDIQAERGDALDPGNTVFTVGISTRSLTATVDEADSELIRIGDSVEVDIGDETITGTIVNSSDTPADQNDPAAAETITIEIQLNEPIDAGDDASVDVEVRIVESLAENVVLVPASALISIGDGTYAVEVVRGDSTAFVAVEPGMFADGTVEVDGIDTGTAVVVPT